VIIRVRAMDESDESWAASWMDGEHGGRWQARKGELIDALSLPGLVAERDGERAGVLFYRREGSDCELFFIAAKRQHQGVGSALLDELIQQLENCNRIWLVTTNDNLDALRFYQRRGFRFVSLRAGAVDETRRTIKPLLPGTGAYGIPIRDEFELELNLQPRQRVHC
jgi:ribosomal protein S18 acetylase RimI-like enzyme